MSERALKEGLAENQPCRMELWERECKGRKKKIYFDVGHNPQAIVILYSYLV